MRQYKFDKPLVESSTPPRSTDVYWVDVDETTGKLESIKEFSAGNWTECSKNSIITSNMAPFDLPSPSKNMVGRVARQLGKELIYYVCAETDGEYVQAPFEKQIGRSVATVYDETLQQEVSVGLSGKFERSLPGDHGDEKVPFVFYTFVKLKDGAESIEESVSSVPGDKIYFFCINKEASVISGWDDDDNPIIKTVANKTDFYSAVKAYRQKQEQGGSTEEGIYFLQGYYTKPESGIPTEEDLVFSNLDFYLYDIDVMVCPNISTAGTFYMQRESGYGTTHFKYGYIGRQVTIKNGDRSISGYLWVDTGRGRDINNNWNFIVSKYPASELPFPEYVSDRKVSTDSNTPVPIAVDLKDFPVYKYEINTTDYSYLGYDDDNIAYSYTNWSIFIDVIKVFKCREDAECEWPENIDECWCRPSEDSPYAVPFIEIYSNEIKHETVYNWLRMLIAGDISNGGSTDTPVFPGKEDSGGTGEIIKDPSGGK